MCTEFHSCSLSRSLDMDGGPKFTRSSATAEGPRDALVSIEKLAIDERPWHTPKVITVAAIKWPYGISLLVCGLCLYLWPCSDTTTFEVNVTACDRWWLRRRLLWCWRWRMRLQRWTLAIVRLVALIESILDYWRIIERSRVMLTLRENVDWKEAWQKQSDAKLPFNVSVTTVTKFRCAH